jgi:competence protein ComGC
MIKFFRKIRYDLMEKNKTGKYFKYAIGEIVLVVIGILIALSINNWNEERKNILNESQLVKNIIEDLRLDSEHINQSLNELTNQLYIIDHLIAKVLNSENELNYDSTELVRYSSDFRPITQQNHAESVSNLKNESNRELLQNYFLMEDRVSDIFLEYEDIIHNQIRPYLRDVGMHNLKSLYEAQPGELPLNFLKPQILDQQLGNVKFQQLLFERRLKTESFKTYLTELNIENMELINILNKNSK